MLALPSASLGSVGGAKSKVKMDLGGQNDVLKYFHMTKRHGGWTRGCIDAITVGPFPRCEVSSERRNWSPVTSIRRLRCLIGEAGELASYNPPRFL